MARYVATLVTHIRIVTEAFLEHMQKDNEAIFTAFEEHLRPDKVGALPPTVYMTTISKHRQLRCCVLLCAGRKDAPISKGN